MLLGTKYPCKVRHRRYLYPERGYGYGGIRREILGGAAVAVQGRAVARGDCRARIYRYGRGDGFRRRHAAADHLGEARRRVLRSGQGLRGNHQHPLPRKLPLPLAFHLRPAAVPGLHSPQRATLLAGLRHRRSLLRGLCSASLYRLG